MQIHKDMRYQGLIEDMESLYLAGCMEEMQELLEKLQTMAETEQDHLGLAASYFYRDILVQQKPDSETYMQDAKRALIIAQTQNIPYYEMKASNSLGIMYSEISDFHTSLEHYLCAIHIAESHPEFRYAAVVLNNVGNLFVWLEDYAEAAIYLERAYEKSVVENANDKQLIGLIVLNLIELYSNMGNYEKVYGWEEKNHDYLDEEERKLIASLNLINEAKKYVHEGLIEKAKEKILAFIEYPCDTSVYIYAFRCGINALRMGIKMEDFELCTQLVEKLQLMQTEATISSFSYDYTLVKTEYYMAFRDRLPQDMHAYYDEYFRESQSRIGQLHNTYAKSLAVKIAYEIMKDENEYVHIQNQLLQKDVEKDIFTNLYNKVSTEKYVRNALQNRCANKLQGMILIDIDLFKRVNDYYGHGVGDEVIAGVAEIIEEVDCESKIAGRFGGDEFLLFLDRQDSIEAIETLVKVLHADVASKVLLPDDRIGKVTLSMGICVIDSEISFEDAFSRADKALYRAKKLGRNRYALCSEEDA